MHLYSAAPRRRALQVAGDAAALGTLALAAWLSGEATRAIDGLARYGLQMQDTGSGLADTLLGAAEGLEGIPLVGDGLGRPLVDAAGAAGELTDAGVALEASIRALAAAVGAAVWIVPALVLVVVWLVPRIRFAFRAAETARIASTTGGRDLLALRAIASRRPAELLAAAPDPLRAIRDGDDAALDALADLEASWQGVRRSRVAPR